MNNKREISIVEFAGSFAENKDTAKMIREKYVMPSLKQNLSITLNYNGVDSTTQSFTHALISEALRQYQDIFFEKVTFKECNTDIQRIITLVTDYMQQHIGE